MTAMCGSAHTQLWLGSRRVPTSDGRCAEAAASAMTATWDHAALGHALTRVDGGRRLSA